MADMAKDSVQTAEFFRLGKEHSCEVAALEKTCFSVPWSEEQFLLAFDRKIFHVFGLRKSGRLLAYCAMYKASGDVEILNLAVRPDMRRQGLAKRLLGLVLQIARNMKVFDVYLEVREHNVPAQRLYKGFGFVQTGVRKKYYPDTGEDALVMHLELATQAKTQTQRIKE